MQGFTQLHFTPLEVLTIIEGVQKRLDKKFTANEIERGVLKDVLIDEDYDLTRVVSFHRNPSCEKYRITTTFICVVLNDPPTITFERGQIAFTTHPHYILLIHLFRKRIFVKIADAFYLMRPNIYFGPNLVSSLQRRMSSKVSFHIYKSLFGSALFQPNSISSS